MSESLTHDEIIAQWQTRTQQAINAMKASLEPIVEATNKGQDEAKDEKSPNQWEKITMISSHCCLGVDRAFYQFNKSPHLYIGPDKAYADYREMLQGFISKCEVSQKGLLRLQKEIQGQGLLPESHLRTLLNRMEVVKRLTTYALNRIGGPKPELALTIALEQIWDTGGSYFERDECIRDLVNYMASLDSLEHYNAIGKDITPITGFNSIITSTTTPAEKKAAFEAKLDELRTAAAKWGFDIDAPEHQAAFAPLREKIELGIQICDEHMRGQTCGR